MAARSRERISRSTGHMAEAADAFFLLHPRWRAWPGTVRPSSAAHVRFRFCLARRALAASHSGAQRIDASLTMHLSPIGRRPLRHTTHPPVIDPIQHRRANPLTCHFIGRSFVAYSPQKRER